MKKIGVYISLVCIGIVSLVFWPRFAVGESSKQVEHILKEEKVELDKLREKIRKQNNKLKAIGQKETHVLQTLENIEDRLHLRQRELKIYKWNLKVNQEQIQKLKARIEEKEEQLIGFERVLKDRLRRIYLDGDMYLVKIIFSADSFGDLLTRIKYMENVMAYDGAVFQKYSEQLRSLELENEKLLKSNSALRDLEKDISQKQASLETEADEKARFLKKIKNEKHYVLRTKKELLNASRQLNDLISKLEEKLVLDEGLSLEDMKGRLVYPVKGKVVRRFGKSWEKKFGTYIVYNGINLKAKKGTEVKSVFFGRVLFTGFLKGYGNLVIIGHGKKYHSLYGHLDAIKVKTGDVVPEGKVIGLAGDSGSLMGETLYFELRHGGKPINPKSWFNLAKK